MNNVQWLDGSVIGCAADDDGVWSTGPTNTVNPTNGSTSLEIYTTDASLIDCLPSVAISSYKTNRSIVKQGTDSVLLYNIGFNCKTVSGQVDTIKLTTAGNYKAADIKAFGFKLWQSSDSIYDKTDLLLDSAAAAGPGTIVFKKAVKLSVNKKTFVFVTVDFSKTATAKDSIYITSTAFSKIIINNGNKTGTDPLAAGGAKTIILFNSPVITATTLNSFNKVIFHTTSTEKYFSITGSNLVPVSDTITITPPANFEISFTSGSGYTSSKLKKLYTGSSLASTKIYVIFKPTAVVTYNANIKVSGGDTTTFVPVNGIGIYPDTIAPKVDTAYAISPTRVLVIFSEAVDATATTWANYNGLNMFSSVTIKPSRDTVTLNLAVSLVIEATNTLTVSGVQDTSRNHNKMVTQNCIIKFGKLPLYHIKQINHVNAKGIPDSLNVNCKLTGVVQSINYSQNGLKYFIHDKTGGICVYRATNVTPMYLAKMGDSVRVVGIIITNSGLCEIQIDSMKKIDTAKITNIAALVAKPLESTEAEVIKIKNLHLVTPSEWPTFAGTARTVHAFNGIDTILLRIERQCNLQGTAVPAPVFEITGMGSQLDVDTPYLSTYQLVPRNKTDLVITAAKDIAIVINELTAIPTKTDRWIELYNPSSIKISLKKFNLSDDTSSKTKYVFPDTAAIPPLGYLQVWDNTHPANPGIHTNFTLNAAGGQLIFTDSLLRTRDYVKYGKQKTDTSFSRIPNGTGSFMHSKMTPVAANVAYPPNYSIAQVTTINANGVVDSLGSWCKINGIVYSINYFNSKPGYKFSIHDGTGGIVVYKASGKFTNYLNPKMGDKLYVSGRISEINGLAVMLAEQVEYMDSNIVLNSPLIVTKLNEGTEGEFVRINGLNMVDYINFPWPKATDSAKVVKAKNATDTFAILIEPECKLHGKWGFTGPQKPFDILGIGWQIDKTSPYTAGYMVCPRVGADLKYPDAIEERNNYYTVYPNPNTGSFSLNNSEGRKLEITVYNSSGKLVLQKTSMDQNIQLQLQEVPGLYLVRVNDQENHSGLIRVIVR